MSPVMSAVTATAPYPAASLSPRASPRRAGALGEQGKEGALLADHPADERVDGDEQAELRQVLAQPEPYRRRIASFGGGCHVVSSRPWCRDQSSGPPMRTVTSRRPRRASR